MKPFLSTNHASVRSNETNNLLLRALASAPFARGLLSPWRREWASSSVAWTARDRLIEPSVRSYGATQRIRELGIREALGGKRSQVMPMVLGQDPRLTAIGVALSLLAAAALTAS